jgi:hypothetical protein
MLSPLPARKARAAAARRADLTSPFSAAVIRAPAWLLPRTAPGTLPWRTGSRPAGLWHDLRWRSVVALRRCVGAMASRSATYDLFLAYPSANKPSARALYDLLQPDVRVFLDERSLLPGARWDQEIPAAQRASRVTVVLISSHADAAWYLGAELVAAIALHRAAPDAHGLVPVVLEPGAALPYGLSHVQAIDAAAEGGLAGVAAHLREVVARLRGQAAPPAVPEVGSAGAAGCDHVRLHERLSRLPDVVFEQIVFHARIDRSLIAPTSAPLATRVLDVAQLAAVDPDLCRRIAAELDRRAPWTR